MRWDDDYIKRVEAAAFRGVQAAAIDLMSHVRVKISVPSRTVEDAGVYTKGKYKGQRKTKLGPRGSSRSRPGEPPHKDLGTLRSSISVAPNPENASARVGTMLRYGRYLELGTSKMGARPYLRPSLAEKRADIVKRIADAIAAVQPSK